LAQRLAAQ